MPTLNITETASRKRLSKENSLRGSTLKNSNELSRQNSKQLVKLNQTKGDELAILSQKLVIRSKNYKADPSPINTTPAEQKKYLLPSTEP